MKLFGLRLRNSGALLVDMAGAPIWFPDKRFAKIARDTFNLEKGRDAVHVTPGPDHDRWRCD